MNLELTQQILNDAMRRASPFVVIPLVSDGMGEDYFPRHLESTGKLQKRFTVEAGGTMPSTGSEGSLRARFKPKAPRVK